MSHSSIALVTGASRGIGEAIARRLAKEGMRVAVVARSAAAIDGLAREIGGIAVAADVTEAGASERIVEQVEGALGPIDVLIPNAGVDAAAKLEETTDAMWESTMAVNVTSVFRLCRLVVPAMVKRNRGRVVVIASNAGLNGYPYTSAYCASKHAVVGLVRAIAAEIAKANVTINAVCPGFVDTSMSDRAVERIALKTKRDPASARAALESLSPQRRWVGADEVAHLVASLLPHEARGIHGQAIALDGGQTMR